jgi:drug/metabolite transporter (DMT)-like permease
MKGKSMTFEALKQPGVTAALAAAILFGIGTPLAKLLLNNVSPWMMAGLLYLGSGLGLWSYRILTRQPAARMARTEIPWFVGAIVSGGVIGPVLLMQGLVHTPASGASLLLNAEGVFTAGLAWFVFKENFDRRIALGMLSILFGAALLTWTSALRFGETLPALAVLGACLAWAVDNNLTRKVALTDASWIAAVKGTTAGVVNLGLAFSLGSELPAWPLIASVMLLGLCAYGLSLVLFVVGLRHLGSARTGAYFSVAPFVGALLALAMGEAFTWQLIAAGVLMAIGIWLHLSEQHEHLHHHEPMEHEHEHSHDLHHQHAHDQWVAPGTTHSHRHRHDALTHSHPHFPDAHHSHSHGARDSAEIVPAIAVFFACAGTRIRLGPQCGRCFKLAFNECFAVQVRAKGAR